MFGKFKTLARLIGFFVVGALALSGGPALLSGRMAYAAPGQVGTAAVSVPTVINFHGVLRNAQGQPVANGTYDLLFRIYPSMTAAIGEALWTEAQQGIAARDGRFSVTLGSTTAIPATVFTESGDRFVGVSVGGVEMQPRQRLASVPYAVQASSANLADLADRATSADNGVPVGTVIDWYRPTSTTPIPDGYRVADGSVVSDPSSPFHGRPLPDLRGRFVRGVGDVAGIGTSGGADTHAHSVDLPSHAHAIDHDHPAWGSTTGGPSESGGTSLADANYWAQHNHTHNFTVDLPYFAGSSGAYDPPAVNSGLTSSLPPYVGLLKLVRIK